MERRELLERARTQLKQAYAHRDRILIQTVNGLGELTKVTNLLSERLREWYAIYFPELYSEDPKVYARLVQAIRKEGLDVQQLEKIVGAKKAAEIAAKVERSLGIDLEPKDLNAIISYAKKLEELYILREEIENYNTALANELCPNISYIAEPQLAAKLVARAGGLIRLANMPASTVQVLGAEKALFKHLKKNTKPPKHGLIFQHALISTSPKKIRGKIARLLATKIAIAAKADAYTKNFIAKKLKEDFDKKIARIMGAQ